MGVRVIRAAVAALLLVGCAGEAPTPEQARALTDEVVRAHLETAVPDGAVVVERIEDETTGCPGQLSPTTRLLLDVPPGIDLEAHLQDVWADLGDVQVIEGGDVAVEVDGVRMNGRRDEPHSILRALGPCTGPI